MADAFPDFDKMTLEEQMAWLESLAKRQGVKDEELTTKADVDIPIPEDAQVDEPGYVPFEGSASARKLKEAKVAAQAESENQAEAEPLMAEERGEEPLWVAAEESPEEIELFAEAEPLAPEETVDEALWASTESAEELDLFAEPESLAVEEPLPAAAESPEEAELFAELDALSQEEPLEQGLWGSTESPEEDLELFAELEALTEEEPLEEALWASTESPEDLELFAEADDTVDPMQWLDSLSAQPEGDLEALFDDSERFVLEGGEETFELEAEPEAPEPLTTADETDTAEPVAVSDDPLGGMDPMLWLESLAKRQGANPDELVTSANLNVAEVDDGTAVDEPGYVPFEGSASARRMKAAEDAESSRVLLPEFEPGDDMQEAKEPLEHEPVTFDEESVADDSMLWLESLAKRQGANPEELLTEADLDIPELPEDTVIDEPGYVEYSPFSILPDQDIELPGTEQVDAGVEDAALSWLEDLVAEPGEDLSEILAFGEDMFEPVLEETEPADILPSAKPVRDDPLAGMTDEEVAYAQAHGQLSGEQELAWLKRQAAKLAEIRESQEADSELFDEEEAEIVPAELPPWLIEMRDEIEQVDLEEVLPTADTAELSAESIDFADWLEETPASEGEALSEVSDFDTAVLAEADVESLWGEAADADMELEEIGLPDDSELAKFLAEGIVPEGADPLAEALDAEFDRKLTGDETEPDWYTDAVSKVTADASTTLEPEFAQADEEPVEGMVEAALGDMPDWLKETGEETIPTLADEVAMPVWLRDTGEAESLIEDGVPDWLTEPEAEVAPAAEEEDLPAWLRELDRPSDEDVVFAEAAALAMEAAEAEPVEPEPEPEEAKSEPPAPMPVAAAEPEARQPVPPPSIPVEPEIRRPALVQPEVRGEALQSITRRLEEDPNDYSTRLAFARALRETQQTVPSLDQYEALIDTSQLLQDVSEDLMNMAEAHGDLPRVRRLLGDTYMRRGMLEEALNAYRGALEQL